MITIEVKIPEEQKQRILNAVNAVVQSIYFYEDELPRTLSIGFSDDVRRDIISQVYVSTWSGRGQVYNEKYKEWKEKQGAGMNFWKLFGDLILNIKSFREGTGWMAGIPAGITDRGGKTMFGPCQTLGKFERKPGKEKEIAMYASVLEFGNAASMGKKGTAYQPPRPVFQYTLQTFAYNHSVLAGEAALNRIGEEWK